MSPGEPGSAEGPAGILVSAEALFLDGVDAPRPLADASTALERLGWIGRPVVIIGEHLAGRRLPADPAQRIGWVRSRLGTSDVAAVAFDEPVVDRPSDAGERAAIEGWRVLSDHWHADRLLTDRDSSVGPARRAGFTVVRIGPRDPLPGPSFERADHEARDLLDAVRCLMTADVFGGAPGRAPR